MTSEQWRTVWRIFEAACQLPEESRESFVQSAGDPETVSEVLQMLENLRQAGADELPEAAMESPDVEWPRLGMTVGRYRIDGTVGRGGMGEVYRAEDTELGRQVAMKFVSRGAVGTSGTVDRFIREARTASSLNHPNVVTVHEVIRVGTSLAIVMELVEGEPLRIRCGTPQPASEVALWGRQIAEALGTAHERGIVHRDIKPENVMLRSDGYVKVLDFGLARELSGLSVASTAGLPPGTLRYMSPEQASGEPVESASDVFSLGVMLYELAAGKHPFDARSPLAAAHSIMTQRAAAPSEVNPAIPAELDSLILAMLEKAPEKRPRAAEVARRLSEPWRARRWNIRRKTAKRVLLAGSGVAGVALVTAVLAATLGRAKYESQIDPSRLKIAPFTTYEGSETQPAFSPDGQKIAFVWTGESGNNRDIYVKSIDETQPLRLTFDPAEDLLPEFSRDGGRIAFLRQIAGNSGPEVMVMRADGSEGRSVGRIIPSFGFYGLTWWPDGKSLVVRDGNSGRASLFRMNLADGSRQRLTLPPESESDGMPAFSPDGKWLAFLRYSASGSKICVLPGSVSPGTRLADPRCLKASSIGDIAWMPDSRRILYTAQDGLWNIDVAGTTPMKIAPGNFSGLAVDGSGRKLAFTRSFHDANIWRMRRDGTGARRVIASSGEDSSPAWSNDGKRVVVRSNRSGNYELYTYSADGGQEKQITNFAAHIDNPHWSPDDAWIAFDGNRAQIDTSVKHHNIYVVSSAGGPARRLTDDATHYEEPSWSSDGRWIYYLKEANPEETWKVPATGGEPILVDSQPMQDLVESPDGQFFYFVRYNATSGIRRRAVSGGMEETLAGTEGVHLYRYWGSGGGGIFFIAGQEDPDLRFLDLRSRKIVRIGGIPPRLLKGPRGLAVSPDGAWIHYTLEDVTASDIMLGTVQ